MAHSTRPALWFALAAVAMTAGCDKPAKTYKHTEDPAFSIKVPAAFESKPSMQGAIAGADDPWKVVKLAGDDTSGDILVQWHDGWSYDDLNKWFDGTQKDLGQVSVFTKEELPGGAGFYIHYQVHPVEYAKSIVRCGDTGLNCMATIEGVEPGEYKEQLIAACRTLTCP